MQDSYFSKKQWFRLKCLNEGLVSGLVFSRWWTGVLWIIVVFLSDSHSDGTHSLQGINCWDTDAETHFSKSVKKNSSLWCPEDEELIFIFGWSIPLIQFLHHHHQNVFNLNARKVQTLLRISWTSLGLVFIGQTDWPQLPVGDCPPYSTETIKAKPFK